MVDSTERRRVEGRSRGRGLVVACLLTLFVLPPAAAAAFEPIEGVWRAETSTRGEYLIQRSGPGVLKMTTIHGNRHCRPDESGFRSRVTEQVELRGGGLDYVFDPVYRFTTDCRIDGVGQGIARVLSAGPQYRHVLCSARPGTGPPQFDAEYRPTAANTVCRFAVRIRAPKRPVRARAIARVPGKVACTSRARVRGRVALLRLVNQANEPVLSIRVRVGGRVVYRYEYPGKLRPRLRLRLPSRAARVTVAIRTTSEKRFQVAQRYGACLPRRR